MAEYGLPYMGSKSSIANDIIKIFPKADNFYDLFGGGFSITHAMLVRRKNDYKKFHFNEIRSGVCELINASISGDFNYDNFKPKFIGREEFFKNKEHDFYTKIIWSFGNNGKNYMFSKEIEPYKKSIHNAIVFNDFDELSKEILGMSKFKEGFTIKDKRLFLRNKIEFYRKTEIPKALYKFLNDKQLQQLQQLQRLEQLERLQQLQQLQQLEQLERLQQLQQLEFYNKSYNEIEIKDNSIIYCDPPYLNTAKYDSDFNHKDFLNWCDNQANPVFISEYKISDDRFKIVFKKNKRSLFSNSTILTLNKEEMVYVNRAGQTLLKKKLS